MSMFSEGSRVARFEHPKDCGRIIRIVAEGIAGAQYIVEWDHHGPGSVHESALVLCDEAPRDSN